MTRLPGLIIQLLLIAGALLSGLSLYEHLAIELNLQGSSFCNVSQTINCKAVLQSNWSLFFGIPLASYGLLFYLSLLLFNVLSRDENLVSSKTSNNALFLFSFLASLISIFLFCISKFVIKTLCPLCLGTYAVNFALLVVAWWLRKEEVWYLRLKAGLHALLSIPLKFLALGSYKNTSTSLPSFGVLTFLILAFSIYILPDYLVNQFFLEKVQKQGVLAAWEAQPVVAMNLSSDSPLTMDYTKGKLPSPIHIIEFSDYECPHCRLLYFVLEDLMKEYGHKAALTYRNYPLDQSCNPGIGHEMHRNSCFAAHFARCAGEQGKFWETTDILFQLKALAEGGESQKVKEEILESGNILGLDLTALEKCLDSQRQMEKIYKDIKEAEALGVQGTPTVFINGKLLPMRSVSPDIFRELFEGILKKGG